jgi:hypothetical protein
MYGDCENACVLKSVTVSLASLRSFPKTLLVVTFLLAFFISFFMPAFRLVSFRMSSDMFGCFCVSYLGPNDAHVGDRVQINVSTHHESN